MDNAQQAGAALDIHQICGVVIDQIQHSQQDTQDCGEPRWKYICCKQEMGLEVSHRGNELDNSMCYSCLPEDPC